VGSGFENPKHQDESSSGSAIPIEERYRLLIDAVADYAIFMLDPSGHVATWNSGAQKIKGYSADEIVGRHFSIFYTPEDLAAGKPDSELTVAALQGRVEDEGWRVRRDGSRFRANVVISAVHDASGALRGFAKVTRDMTERVRLTELEHAAELTAQIQHTREEEQKRIARELHDDLGQQLTALKMGLAMLEAHLGAIGNTHPMLAQIQVLQGQIDAMTASVRRIASDLRPTVLDDLGLLAALDWLADEFHRRYGVNVASHLETGDLEFAGSAATAIFRLVQEALTNVARHAQANEWRIDMSLAGDVCTIQIEDDGNGAQLDAPRMDRSFGLLGMRERVRQLNGSLSIDTAPGRGFLIAIQLPVSMIASGSIS
jgi:PAS domain S-box-containing protein